ncbi:MAG: PEP-CTERM sorting domain-containing protein [Phycisphaeraceae bacterium]|nr:PEP-CTERM sorting domain-containing protein [Phycisphaeraceae bacterium]
MSKTFAWSVLVCVLATAIISLTASSARAELVTRETSAPLAEDDVALYEFVLRIPKPGIWPSYGVYGLGRIDDYRRAIVSSVYGFRTMRSNFEGNGSGGSSYNPYIWNANEEELLGLLSRELLKSSSVNPVTNTESPEWMINGKFDYTDAGHWLEVILDENVRKTVVAENDLADDIHWLDINTDGRINSFDWRLLQFYVYVGGMPETPPSNPFFVRLAHSYAVALGFENPDFDDLFNLDEFGIGASTSVDSSSSASPTIIPEPASVGLLLAGGLMLLRRRG